MNNNFEITLPIFKGPFDLLLFFIERDELNIYDIPISKITNDFLDYIHHLEQFDMEIASDFIFMAATLMRIKSKMMLPRFEIDEKGNEIDPREELVAHLIEYKRYKSVLSQLQDLENSRLIREKRGNISNELLKISKINQVDYDLHDIDLFKLLKVFDKVMKRFETDNTKIVHTVYQFPFTVDEKKEAILNRLIKKTSFVDLFSSFKDKIEAIFEFLAILELVQLKKIKITISEEYNSFWIEKI